MHERWEDYYCRGFGVDPEIARERLDFLRREQERAEAMFNELPDEPLFYTNSLHPLDFSCQCKMCVRMHTITMQDREFLGMIGVVWTSTTTPTAPATQTALESPRQRKI